MLNKLIQNHNESKTMILSDGTKVEKPRSKKIFIIIALIVAILVSIQLTGFDLVRLIERLDKFFNILFEMFPPNLSYFNEIADALFETIAMSLIGTIAGAIIAIPTAFLASTNIIHNKVIVSVLRFIFAITRTLPTLIIALIATFIFNFGSFAGTIAIAIFTFSFVGKLLYQQIETVDMKPYEALESMGSSKIKAFSSAILPQILPTYVANCLYCFEGSIRHSAILGYVGAGGIGLLLNENLGWKEYDKVGTILITLLITIGVIELLNNFVRKKLT